MVASNGSGQSTNVQAAIMFVPSSSRTHPAVIHIKPGIYKELIYVQREKRFFRLVGDDPEKTILTYHLQANLPCINARDAMPHGGTLSFEIDSGHLEVPEQDSHQTCPPTDFVNIVVQDSGAGIPSQDLPRIFEPFFTTKEPGHGTGLGLAMVYGFVQNHDGFVKVESEPGNGARFTITLPTIPAPTSHTDGAHRKSNVAMEPCWW